MSINRRQFIKQLSAGAAVATIAPQLYSCSDKNVKITILHTNDVHSQIEPLPADHYKFPNAGGFAKRAELIQKIRQENEHVVLLDCGDIFQGTPYFNFYKGRLEIELMNKMKYDAATIGNHEFDNGIQELSSQIQRANFPFICSNYNFEQTPMEGLTLPFTTIQKGPVKIGLIGLGIELEGLVSPDSYGNTRYSEPIEIANKTAQLLKSKEGCQFIICISHLGFEYESDKVSDVKLAQNTSDIDLILGGHTHTFMDQPKMVKNQKQVDVMINQMGWGGVNLGRIDVSFSNKTSETTVENKVYHV